MEVDPSTAVALNNHLLSLKQTLADLRDSRSGGTGSRELEMKALLQLMRIRSLNRDLKASQKKSNEELSSLVKTIHRERQVRDALLIKARMNEASVNRLDEERYPELEAALGSVEEKDDLLDLLSVELRERHALLSKLESSKLEESRLKASVQEKEGINSMLLAKVEHIDRSLEPMRAAFKIKHTNVLPIDLGEKLSDSLFSLYSQFCAISRNSVKFQVFVQNATFHFEFPKMTSSLIFSEESGELVIQGTSHFLNILSNRFGTRYVQQIAQGAISAKNITDTIMESIDEDEELIAEKLEIIKNPKSLEFCSWNVSKVFAPADGGLQIYLTKNNSELFVQVRKPGNSLIVAQLQLEGKKIVSSGEGEISAKLAIAANRATLGKSNTYLALVRNFLQALNDL